MHPRILLKRLILYGRGIIANDEGGLLRRFFSTVPEGLQIYAIKFVGRSLAEDARPTREVLERFKKLWAWLVAQAEHTPADSAERVRLESFGSWFTSDAFDRGWSIAALENALRLARRVNDIHFVIEALARIAPEFPSESVRCVRAIIKADSEGWEISSALDETRSILKAGLGSA